MVAGSGATTKDVNIPMDPSGSDVTGQDLKFSLEKAKRRHSCLPGLLPSVPGRRNSAHRQTHKKEPWYPISI